MGEIFPPLNMQMGKVKIFTSLPDLPNCTKPIIATGAANRWFLTEYVNSQNKNVSQMLNVVDEDEKLLYTLYISGQNREMLFLTEYVNSQNKK